MQQAAPQQGNSDPVGVAAQLAGQQPSIYAVTRELKREQHTLFNCLASILSDAAFIQEIKLLYPDLPLLANLRAGGWYSANPDGTCYFKSTDGHQNNCNFSVTRLNWHVAELAAQRGGVMIVDATRKGKRFPDALSKTIPIWAAVLNRAVARVRAYDAQKAQRRRTYAAADGEVFTAVEDTQTSISVRTQGAHGHCADSSTPALAADAALQQAPQQQPQQLAASPARSGCQPFLQIQQQEQQQEQERKLPQQEQEQSLEQLVVAPEHPRAPKQHVVQHRKQQQAPTSLAPACATCPAASGAASHSIRDMPCGSAGAAMLGCGDVNSSSNPVVQLLVDCMGPSVDLMSGLSSSQGDSLSAAGAAAGTTLSSPAAVPTPEPGNNSSSSYYGASSTLQCPAAAAAAPASAADTAPLVPLTSAAAAAAAAALGVGACHTCGCCLQRSKSAHLSPQPSLHEWLDEMDVLRRFTLAAESRSGMKRAAPRVSCPANCDRAVADSSKATPHRAAPAVAEVCTPACAASAPAVSCLLASSVEEGAPSTPAAAVCPAAHLPKQLMLPRAGSSRVELAPAHNGEAAPPGVRETAAATPAAFGSGASSQCQPAAAAAASSCDSLGSPAFLLPAAIASSLECESPSAEPLTPRLVFGGNSSSCRSSSGEEATHWQQSLPLPLQQPANDSSVLQPSSGIRCKQLRFADQQTGSQDSSSGSDAGAGTVLSDFAFPPPHQLAASAGAASAGSSLGAEAAGRLASSGVASSGSSISSSTSGLVRLPDMPVVVLNGTSHQPGDAASILDIWRGTDLEDVASLPAISDFRPGVYHLPDGSKQRGLSTDHDCWPNTQQQQQAVQERAAVGGLCTDSSNGNSSRTAVSWAAEVCLRSQQQLSGRISVSNWLDDDETGAAAEALCAFAVPALSPPSCCSSGGSGVTTDEAEAATSCCSGAASCGSVCSDDSRPSSRPGSAAAAASNKAESAASIGSGAAAAVGSECCNGDAGVWDTALHLPLWLSSSERAAIEAKLDGWVEKLLEVGADVRGLAAMLSKPLRPLWVSQASLIWTNQVAHPSSLPFTPLLLVSASQPHAGERHPVRAAWMSLAKAMGSSGSPERPLTPGLAGAALSSSSSDSEGGDSSEDEAFDSLGLSCSWGSSSRCKNGLRALGRSRGKHTRKRNGAVAGASNGKNGANSSSSADVGSWSFVYVPGAGDDEESWAAGLTPALFWQHCDALLCCGPSNIRPAVKQLLQLHKSACFGGAGASLAAAAVRSLAAPPSNGRTNGSSAALGRPLSPLGLKPSNSSSSAVCSQVVGPGGVPAVQTDRHHPAPQGCASAALHVVPAAPGAFWLGDTGLAVGNLEGASAADVWRSVDAVLCCGTAMVPVLQGEYNAMRLAAARVPATPSAAALSSSAPPTSMCVQQLGMGAAPDGQQQQEAAGQAALSSSFCTAAHSHWVRQQQQLGTGAAANGDGCLTDSPTLEFSRVNQAQPARKPSRKNGMLSALLSKAGAAPSTTAANTTSSSSCAISSGSSPAAVAAADAAAATDTAGSECSSVCSSSYYSVCSEEGTVAAAVAGGHAAGSSSSQPRLMWLPVQPAKRDRSSLKQHLQQALEFVSGHIAAGRTVLLHDLEGHDSCVCLAIAVLSGCFAAPPAAAAASPGTQLSAAEPVFVRPWTTDSQQQQEEPPCVPATPQPCQEGHQALPGPPALVTKQSVRQQLAWVSGLYPLARPTRGMLKQVFNFFEEQRRHAAAAPQPPVV